MNSEIVNAWIEHKTIPVANETASFRQCYLSFCSMCLPRELVGVDKDWFADELRARGLIVARDCEQRVVVGGLRLRRPGRLIEQEGRVRRV